MSDKHFKIFMSKQHGRENDSVAVEPTLEKSDVAHREESILAFWNEHDIFNKSVATPAGDAPKEDFVFYDGPPFATGTPHYGHILASAIKDAIPRYKTMQGYRVERKWGWDCHGLPLENLIEKKLGLATKRDIEAYGVKNFNEAARDTVMEYADYWKMAIPRMGRWADMENDYKTMDSTYTESVWWVFSELHKKGLVFEGFKTMHLCPRCGTTLSNFEVNLGYKDIKDIAVTVKLPLLDKEGAITDTSLLVWTTTPWTLPGNLAAAVNKDFEYVKVLVKGEAGEEKVILAKGRLAQLGDAQYEILEEVKGSDLVGLSYQPPFSYLQNEEFEKTNAFKIWHADYVELGTEGTGAVHIAPAYGEDDMQLAKANGVPIIHHVDADGHFMPFVTDFAGKLVKPKDDDSAGVDHKDADIEILKALQNAGKIFKKENITHSYPHCWRCDTPLLNYATTSWFVNVPKIKDELVAQNDAVKWVPEHVGTNRFGKWLEGARDWAVSRQRYWGAPLPIWKNPKSGEYKVIGSLAELQSYLPKRGNTYTIMRHAEAQSNIGGVIDAVPDEENPLTEKGKTDAVAAAQALKDKGVTRIVHSGMQRARLTAEIVAHELGLPASAVTEDVRMQEFKVGPMWEGKTWAEFNAQFKSEEEKFIKQSEGGESRYDLIKRVGEFLYDYDATCENEHTLVIGHGSSLFALESVAQGADYDQMITLKKKGYLKNTEARPLPFVPLPHNDKYELDYHRPYIDEIELFDTDGTKLERIKDVFDCWFESGSMPYGQHHYPFSCDEGTFAKEKFPAEFIAEGLDQTRGWFYSLIVLGTALFGESPYQNVIVNGLVMAEDGKKMSKSLRNYPDPMELVDRVGADAVRYYLLSSPIIRGEDLNFSEKEVTEQMRKNIGRLHNVLAMYEMYADGTTAGGDSAHVLDRWIIARLNQLITEVTAGYESYELDKATRPIADFIDDVSVWYLRRSRERLKSDDVADKALALGTLRFVLRELAKVMAPVMPFYAEHLYLAVKEESEAESVHLTKWPKVDAFDPVVIDEMGMVREFVTLALEARTKANIKVRQPLQTLLLNVEMGDEYKSVIADEVNVKEIVYGEGQEARLVLDTNLTPELLSEGAVREVMRTIQDMRKAGGLEPADRIMLTIDTDEAGQEAIKSHLELLTKTVGASEVEYAPAGGATVEVADYRFGLAIKKMG
ncbi:MAG: class I tRNA ligase family protein [Candidatus Paceibacteria bacterium]